MTKTKVVLVLSALILGGSAFIAGRISNPPPPVLPDDVPFKTAVVVVPVQSLPPEPAPVLQSLPPEAPPPQASMPPPPVQIDASVPAPQQEQQVQSLASEVAAVRETIADDDQTRAETQAEAAGQAEAVRSALNGLKTAEANLVDGDTDGLRAAIETASNTLGDSAQPLLNTARDRLENEDLNGVRDALAVLLDSSPH